jgi:lipopolysaccharide export system protein LptA
VIIGLLLAACGEEAVPRRAEAELHGVHARFGAGEQAPEIWLASAFLAPDGTGHGSPAEARVDGPVPLVVTGDKSAWSLAEKHVVFEGNVRATRGEVVLTADRMELWWAGEKVDRVVATGTVQVRRGARLATAGAAELTVATGRIDLRESPVIVEAGNRLVGDAMALYLDDDRLDCEHCRLEIAGEALSPAAP